MKDVRTVTTVKDLRQSGWKVRVYHHRNIERGPFMPDGRKFTLAAKGGTTEVMITSPGDIGTTSFSGVALCSDEDNYSKKRGVQIALGRACKAYSASLITKGLCK